ncbi:MAG: type II toxin-antitoxin system RelE/ParE family toxin [Candidatus Methylomirabilis sp.]
MRKRAPVVWTRPALDSLLDIVRQIQVDEPVAAHRFASTLKASVARLKHFPESGRIVPEFQDSGVREIVVGEYRVVYRVSKAPVSVQILTIRHGVRLMESSPESGS